MLLTLFWKRCNTGGIVAGMLVGTLSAIGLVMVSPNLTYPLAIKAAQEKNRRHRNRQPREAQRRPHGRRPSSPRRTGQGAIVKSEKAKAGAEAAIAKIGNDRTSIVGLEKPLFELRNPGLVSIPLGFLAVIPWDRCCSATSVPRTWDELYVRQNTGLLAAKAAAR
ncbi:MAG: hypothetical protein U1F54_15470 [Burkholderiales bacterium]